MEVYAQARLASQCFLSEALFWILVLRVPAVTISEDPEEWWQGDQHAGEGGHVADLNG